ncbi:TetR/AcrR family transcriptional regulator [Streptomyces sp. NPDC020681]|uniref:TetR/AcrR family transcriptional regulator n=1 Tax=Streptomyces sp. NPDC020681 TaxID=3365083 RepID=UPI0037945C06
MTTTGTPGTSGRADANRRRIMQVAITELLRDQDASMDQIARAAGVVRRTVYGHFPSRDALISALVDDAVATVAEAHERGLAGAANAPEALARATLAAWEIADRYRLLVALAQRSVTMEGIKQRLAPVRKAECDLLQQGIDEGEFSSPLPAAALAYVQEQQLFGLMEAVNDGALPAKDAGRAAAVIALLTAGFGEQRARDLVAKLQPRDLAASL